MNIEEKKQEINAIINKIGKSEKRGDYDAVIQLKKELYRKKLELLDLVTKKNEKLTIPARELRNKVKSMKPAPKYSTGVKEIDNNLEGGFEVGSLIQLAGANFVGKTTLFLRILANIAKYNKAVFFNFEMGERRIVKRLNKLIDTEEQWDNLLINSESRDIEDLVMEISLLAEDGIKFFAIDSRMKITKKGNESEHQKVSYISKRLSETAIKNDIIILLINQISEEDLKSKRFSLKGSGDQLYDADLVFFIMLEGDNKRKLICTKNRQNDKLFAEYLPNFETTAKEITYEG